MMKARQFSRLLAIVLLIIGAATNALAQEYITDIMTIGTWKGNGSNLKKEYRDKGWTVLDKDLNANAGGWDVYIAYKTSSTANPENGYITDIRASNSWDQTRRYSLRNYHRAPCNDGFNGDMNKGAGGSDIIIFYTRERPLLSGHGDTKRVITSLETHSHSDDGDPETGVVRWFEGSAGACDMNNAAGGDDIYVYMRFATQKMKWTEHPVIATDLTYNGEEQDLVAKNPWEANLPGKLKYRLAGGKWSSNVPKGLEVGNYIVEAFLSTTTSYGIIYTYEFADESSIIRDTVTINPPVVTAGNLMGVFNQTDKKVLLTWDEPVVPGNYSDFKWLIYRDGEQIAELAHDEHSYIDTGYTNETAPVYDVYYVSNFWDADTLRDDAKTSVTVNTTRSVPINNLRVDQEPDRLVFTWTSDAYPEGFGHEFRIYVGDEEAPIYKLKPADMQTSFQWEHRTTDQHNNPQNKIDPETGVPYTEEPLNACNPNDYRIDGVIGDKVLNTYTAKLKAIAFDTAESLPSSGEVGRGLRQPRIVGTKCVGCHLCRLVCPTGAIGTTKRINKKA